MIVDLRSDTVTQPTQAMKQAMVDAPLGDDVLGDDPTVLALQARCATLLGKEAAIFMPSGSMANQAAIRAHTRSGDEIIAHESSHVYKYEAAAPAAISGCSFAFLQGDRGMFEAADVEGAIRPADHHFPESTLLVVENTQNTGGGAVWPLAKIEAVTATARGHGLRCHLDGARLWNACLAVGVTPAQWSEHFDTVSCCFSKGLGCPVGSIVAGDAVTMHRAHRTRKMLGGAMRQSGMLAAAAIYALDHHVERIADDHRRAKQLAEALYPIPGVGIDPSAIETNILYFDVPPGRAQALQDALDTQGVRLLAVGASRMRAVTHLDVTDAGISHAIKVLKDTLGSAA
jgi:threonine aldolase